jgi:hypothetical protein
MRGSAVSKNPLVVLLTLFLLTGIPIGAAGADFRPNSTAGADSRSNAPGAAKPFDTVTLTVHVARSAALGSFAELWDSSPALRIDAATPVYAGIAQAGVHVFAQRALDPDVPDFDCVHVWLGWAYRWDFPRRVSFAAGVDAGVSYMMFDDEATARARKEETELGFGVDSRVAYAWTPAWSFVLSGTYRKILTRHPVEYVFVGVGVGRVFSTPRWLREFLE